MGCSYRLLFAAIIVVVSFAFGRAAAGEAERRLPFGGVVDFGRIFSSTERASLELTAGRIARHSGLDVFVATIDDQSLTWSWRGETHRQMIDRVFRDVKSAATRHFGDERPLVLLSVFKHHPVLHLSTDKADLATALLFDNFYSGARGAFDRVRDPKQDSHHDAAIRYLEAFAKRLLASTTDERVQTLKSLLLRETDLLGSRDLIENSAFEPFYICFEWLRLHLMQMTGLLPTASLLLLFAVWHLGGIAALQFAPEALLGTGSLLPALIRNVAAAIQQALLIPALLLVYSITSADLENLVHLGHIASGWHDLQRLEVRTYLEMSEEIVALSPPFSDPAVLIAMVVVAGTTIVRVLACRDPKRWWPTIGELVTSLIKTPAFVFSIVIFPGALQAYFVFVALATQALLWRLSMQRAAAAKADVPTPSDARAATDIRIGPNEWAGRTLR